MRKHSIQDIIINLNNNDIITNLNIECNLCEDIKDVALFVKNNDIDTIEGLCIKLNISSKEDIEMLYKHIFWANHVSFQKGFEAGKREIQISICKTLGLK